MPTEAGLELDDVVCLKHRPGRKGLVVRTFEGLQTGTEDNDPEGQDPGWGEVSVAWADGTMSNEQGAMLEVLDRHILNGDTVMWNDKAVHSESKEVEEGKGTSGRKLRMGDTGFVVAVSQYVDVRTLKTKALLKGLPIGGSDPPLIPRKTRPLHPFVRGQAVIARGWLGSVDDCDVSYSIVLDPPVADGTGGGKAERLGICVHEETSEEVLPYRSSGIRSDSWPLHPGQKVSLAGSLSTAVAAVPPRDSAGGADGESGRVRLSSSHSSAKTGTVKSFCVRTVDLQWLACGNVQNFCRAVPPSCLHPRELDVAPHNILLRMGDPILVRRDLVKDATTVKNRKKQSTQKARPASGETTDGKAGEGDGEGVSSSSSQGPPTVPGGDSTPAPEEEEGARGDEEKAAEAKGDGEKGKESVNEPSAGVEQAKMEVTADVEGESCSSSSSSSSSSSHPESVFTGVDPSAWEGYEIGRVETTRTELVVAFRNGEIRRGLPSHGLSVTEDQEPPAALNSMQNEVPPFPHKFVLRWKPDDPKFMCEWCAGWKVLGSHHDSCLWDESVSMDPSRSVWYGGTEVGASDFLADELHACMAFFPNQETLQRRAEELEEDKEEKEKSKEVRWLAADTEGGSRKIVLDDVDAGARGCARRVLRSDEEKEGKEPSRPADSLEALEGVEVGIFLREETTENSEKFSWVAWLPSDIESRRAFFDRIRIRREKTDQLLRASYSFPVGAQSTDSCSDPSSSSSGPSVAVPAASSSPSSSFSSSPFSSGSGSEPLPDLLGKGQSGNETEKKEKGNEEERKVWEPGLVWEGRGDVCGEDGAMWTLLQSLQPMVMTKEEGQWGPFSISRVPSEHVKANPNWNFLCGDLAFVKDPSSLPSGLEFPSQHPKEVTAASGNEENEKPQQKEGGKGKERRVRRAGGPSDFVVVQGVVAGRVICKLTDERIREFSPLELSPIQAPDDDDSDDSDEYEDGHGDGDDDEWMDDDDEGTQHTACTDLSDDHVDHGGED